MGKIDETIFISRAFGERSARFWFYFADSFRTKRGRVYGLVIDLPHFVVSSVQDVAIVIERCTTATVEQRIYCTTWELQKANPGVFAAIRVVNPHRFNRDSGRIVLNKRISVSKGAHPNLAIGCYYDTMRLAYGCKIFNKFPLSKSET